MFCRSPVELALMVASQRKKLGLSQAAVAERVGLKQKTISAFENNPENTQLSTLYRILSAVELDIILTSKSDENKSITQWEHEW